MTTRADITLDTLAEELVFYCKKCGRPFAGMPEHEIQERRKNGTFNEESARIVDTHLTTCRGATDTGAIEQFCDEAIAANPKSVADYKAGKVAALNALKGQVMKLSKGKANPNVVGEILERKLKA